MPSQLRLLSYKAITLDLDDTLWPIGPTIQNAEVALRQYLIQQEPKVQAVYAQTGLLALIRSRLLAEQPELAIQLGLLRKSLIREVLLQAGGDLRWVEPAFEVFFATRNRVQHYPDTLAALARLAGRYPLFALTNGNADLHAVGIAQYFVGGLSAPVVGVAKPDPHIFELAAQQLGVGPQEILHVGDDPALDVQGAMAVGLAGVWVNRTGAIWPHDTPPDHEVTDLLALCDLLGC